MTTDQAELSVELLQRALDETDEPTLAASVLISAAATILQRIYGVEPAIELLHQGLDEAGAAWRRARAQ